MATNGGKASGSTGKARTAPRSRDTVRAVADEPPKRAAANGGRAKSVTGRRAPTSRARPTGTSATESTATRPSRSTKPTGRRAARGTPPPASSHIPVDELHQAIEDAAGEARREWPNAPLRRGLGVALLGLAGAGRFTSGAVPTVPGPGGELPAEPVMDVALGLVDVMLEAGERAALAVRRQVNPILQRAWGPAIGPVSGMAGTGLRILAAVTEPLAERGRRLRADSEHEAAAAVAGVLPETIQLVMEQLDLTELAIDHVDLQRVLDVTGERVDLTDFALRNIDLERVIEASLDAVDFTGLAISRMDFARAITAAMEQVDMIALAREGLDPARVAAYLRSNVDVMDALRSAPTAVTTEAVRNVRQTMDRFRGRPAQ